jgi:hypothetical protein
MLLPDTVANVEGSLVWNADGTAALRGQGSVTLLGYKVMRHKIGTDAAADTWCARRPTSRSTPRSPAPNRRFLFITHSSTVSTGGGTPTRSTRSCASGAGAARARYSTTSIVGDRWLVRTN